MRRSKISPAALLKNAVRANGAPVRPQVTVPKPAVILSTSRPNGLPAGRAAVSYPVKDSFSRFAPGRYGKFVADTYLDPEKTHSMPSKEELAKREFEAYAEKARTGHYTRRIA